MISNTPQSNKEKKHKAPSIIAPSYSSFAKAIYLLCEVKNIEYIKSTTHNNQEVSFYSDKLNSLNPWNKLPLLQHNDLIIGESIAIARYINELKCDELNLFGSDLVSKANIEYWLHAIAIYADEAIIRNMVLEFAFPKGENNSIRFDVVQNNISKLKKCLKILDNQISNNFIIENRMTICDVFLIPMITYLNNLPEEFNCLDEFKNVKAYLQYHNKNIHVQNIFKD